MILGVERTKWSLSTTTCWRTTYPIPPQSTIPSRDLGSWERQRKSESGVTSQTGTGRDTPGGFGGDTGTFPHEESKANSSVGQGVVLESFSGRGKKGSFYRSFLTQSLLDFRFGSRWLSPKVVTEQRDSWRVSGGPSRSRYGALVVDGGVRLDFPRDFRSVHEGRKDVTVRTREVRRVASGTTDLREGRTKLTWGRIGSFRTDLQWEGISRGGSPVGSWSGRRTPERRIERPIEPWMMKWNK